MRVYINVDSKLVTFFQKEGQHNFGRCIEVPDELILEYWNLQERLEKLCEEIMDHGES